MDSLKDGKQMVPFPHRLNADGTFDSICPKCFHTVATGRPEAIALIEKQHSCSGLEELAIHRLNTMFVQGGIMGTSLLGIAGVLRRKFRV